MNISYLYASIDEYLSQHRFPRRLWFVHALELAHVAKLYGMVVVSPILLNFFFGLRDRALARGAERRPQVTIHVIAWRHCAMFVVIA